MSSPSSTRCREATRARDSSRARSRGLGALVLAALAACAAPGTYRLPTRPSGIPDRVELGDVPFYPQEHDHCGPASLATVLHWSGEAVEPRVLAPELLTPARGGTLQSEMLSATRRHGRIAYPVTDTQSLLRELAAGHPVVVLQNLGFFWSPVWHYAVVIGYDLPDATVVLGSGRERRRVLPFGLFDRTWRRADRWGLAVLPADRAPASLDRDRYLTAVLGLEQARRWSEAAQAYATALEHWPRSLRARLGLGNSRYALGDWPGAEAEFRRASVEHPDAAAPLGKLAQVLHAQGRHDEARRATRRARALGPAGTRPRAAAGGERNRTPAAD